MTEREHDIAENYFSLNDVEETEDDDENHRLYKFLNKERFMCFDPNFFVKSLKNIE